MGDNRSATAAQKGLKEGSYLNNFESQDILGYVKRQPIDDLKGAADPAS